MAKGFKHGAGGGNQLNFKVVGGTSAPSNPTTNTIWVNTSTEITSWVFHATQPSGAAGKVWIQTGITSAVPFNAVKKNRVTVYPMSAKQYVNGAWVAKTAKIYQNGEWTSTQHIIVPNTAITWSRTEGAASASKSTSSTIISITSQAETNGTADFSKINTIINLTSRSVFYIEGSYSMNNTTGSDQLFKIQLLNSSGSVISNIVNKTIKSGSSTGTVGFENTIDVTTVSGDCKLELSCRTYSTSALTFKTTINKCRVY